jgi:hypothetical protein
MTKPLKHQTDLAVLLVGNHGLTPNLRQLLETPLRKFADDYNIHIFVQETESYPSDEWEESSECTLNYCGKALTS